MGMPLIRGYFHRRNSKVRVNAIEFARFGTPVVSLISIAFACGLATPALAQGLPIDWSHRHVINSNPETREQAEAKGTLDKWVERANDPRFILQMERKERAAAVKANRTVSFCADDGSDVGRGTKQMSR